MEYFNKLVDARIIEMISDEPLPFQFMENGKKIKSSSDVEKYFAQRKL